MKKPKVGETYYVSESTIKTFSALLRPGFHTVDVVEGKHIRFGGVGTWILDEHLITEEIYNSPLFKALQEIK